jgi:hypothetical protein
MDFDRPYNQRLFEDNAIRGYLHNARFRWFKAKCEKYQPEGIRMLELGCFDGRLIEFCPSEPIHYEGYDAGWEGGLDVAEQKYAGRRDRIFRRAKAFNVGAAMETLEHLPPDQMHDYLDLLRRAVDGHLFFTVPNEKGPVFLTKYAVKAFLGSNQKYRWSEVANAALCRLSRVERDDHKGFDYDVLIKQIQQHFDILEVDGIPFSAAPRLLGFTVGIVARSR